MEVDRILVSLITAENFGKALEEVIKKVLRLDVKDFAKEAGIPESTIYKIISGKREPNLRTLRLILNTIHRKLSPLNEGFIAIIASRSVLNQLERYEIKVENEIFSIREYPANSFEEAIVSAVRAEKEGAKVIVCAPILSPTLEKIVKVPIVTIIPKKDLLSAIEIASRKIKSNTFLAGTKSKV
ncbi:MAG: helix-turn-helix domain-containing protein [Archaeoglobaceae archaeon]